MALPISRRLFWHLKRVERWRAESVKVDLSEVDGRFPIKIKQDDASIAVSWSTDRVKPDDPAVLTIARDPAKPLFADIQIAADPPNMFGPPAALRSLAKDI